MKNGECGEKCRNIEYYFTCGYSILCYLKKKHWGTITCVSKKLKIGENEEKNKVEL